MSKWIDEQIAQAKIHGQWQSMIFRRDKYIATLEALKKSEEALIEVENLADPELRRKCEDTHNRILAATGPALKSIEDLGKE